MESIIDYGNKGSEQLHEHGIEVATPQALYEDEALTRTIGIIGRMPTLPYDIEAADGVKHTVNMHVLDLQKERVFKLATTVAAYEPIVYAQHDGRRVMGMMSANYDTKGEDRLPSLKIIPLAKAYPLTSKLLPDARAATMLTGAVSAERAGVGSHENGAGNDFEHKATILGAISVQNSTIATGHLNHDVRGGGSAVATGLTNGRLGNLYSPDSTSNDFKGYGAPMVIEPTNVSKYDMLLFPEQFLDNAEAWGGMYDEAPRIMLGAGMQALQQRSMDTTKELGRLTDELNR